MIFSWKRIWRRPEREKVLRGVDRDSEMSLGSFALRCKHSAEILTEAKLEE